QRDPSSLRFVAEKLSQLSEAPIMLLRPLPFENRHPVTYPRQVFQGQRGLRVFGILDEACGQTVIRPALKARLASGHLLQAPFGTPGANRLVGLASGMVALSDALYGIACIAVTA